MTYNGKDSGKEYIYVYIEYIRIYICVYILYIHIYIKEYVYILFQNLFHYWLLQDIEYSSLCYKVGACWLSKNGP